MLKWLWIVPIVLVLLTVIALVAGQAGLLRGRAPADLGLRDGRFKPPSKSPNSVSSQADLWPNQPQAAKAQIAPLALVGDGAATLARIEAIVRATPGAEIVNRDGDYIYATFTTRWMRYTDDVEFSFDPARAVVQVRSASRLGKSDLGANRARIEALRAQLTAR